jgi:hypothetical protein
MAVLAAQAQETFFQSAALQVRIELLIDAIRQWPTRHCPHVTECRIVLLDEFILQRRLGSVACVARWIDEGCNGEQERACRCQAGLQ